MACSSAAAIVPALWLRTQSPKSAEKWRGPCKCRLYQALKGVGPIVAATIIAEVGDFSRFAHPRQLVASLAWHPVNTVAALQCAPAALPRPAVPLLDGAVRSRLELQDNAEGRAMDEGTLPAGAAKHHRSCMEGAIASAQDLPSPYPGVLGFDTISFSDSDRMDNLWKAHS